MPSTMNDRMAELQEDWQPDEWPDESGTTSNATATEYANPAFSVSSSGLEDLDFDAAVSDDEEPGDHLQLIVTVGVLHELGRIYNQRLKFCGCAA